MKPPDRLTALTAHFSKSAIFRWWLWMVFAALLVVAGCGRRSQNNGAADDPQMAATLANLTRELHHTMPGRKLNRDFDEFVALRHLEVPPPPDGKKYAIDEHWKVILVDR